MCVFARTFTHVLSRASTRHKHRHRQETETETETDTATETETETETATATETDRQPPTQPQSTPRTHLWLPLSELVSARRLVFLQRTDSLHFSFSFCLPVVISQNLAFPSRLVETTVVLSMNPTCVTQTSCEILLERSEGFWPGLSSDKRMLGLGFSV